MISLSAGEVKRRGLAVETHDPTGELVEPPDPGTGAPLPARPLMPDPGWMTNPGKSQWGGIVDAAVRAGKWETLPGLKGPDAYRRKALANVSPFEITDFDESMLLPEGRDDEFYREEFMKRYGEEKLLTDALGEPVILSLRSFMVDKSKKSWKFNKQGHGVSIPVMEKMLMDPFEVWLTPQKSETGRVRLTKRYIGMWKTEDKRRVAGLSIYEATDGVFTGVTHFVPLTRAGEADLAYAERQRAGILLYGKGSGRHGSRAGNP